MGRIFYSFEAYETALDTEIATALANPNGRVQVGAKKEIVEEAKKSVYDTYTPEVDLRRYGHGGTLDPSEYNATTSLGRQYWGQQGKGFTLYIIADVPWSNCFGHGEASGNDDLVETIEQHGIYGAHPRPFMNAAEYNYAYWNGGFGKDLVTDLEAAGL